jgi:hypothetical protein
MTKLIIGNLLVEQNVVKTLGAFSARVWPARSGYKCHWCCHNFATVPVFIPHDFCRDTDVFYARGNYCSFNCAVAHIQEDAAGKELELIHLLYRRMTGEDVRIMPAPSRETLVDFGGNLTLEQFRASGDQGTHHYIMLPSMIPAGCHLVESVPLTGIMPECNERRETQAMLVSDSKLVQRKLF